MAAIRRRHETHIPQTDFELAPTDLVVAALRKDARGRIKKYVAQGDE